MEIKRTMRTLTPEESARMKELAEKVEAERPLIDEKFRRMELAAEEATFSGQLRRAIHGIHQRGLSLPEFLAQTGMTWEALERFLLAESPLPSDAIERIAEVLNLELQVADATENRGD
ncbi:MAG: hypothetical protein KF777_06310 [Planctomycetaceae bacterium]|nr:hypothetical protein [Planctomycetaceae bacterium]